MGDMIPYGRQSISDEDIDAVVEVLKGDWLTCGPTVERFEAALCEYTGARHAIAVSNGTAAEFCPVVNPCEEAMKSPYSYITLDIR